MWHIIALLCIFIHWINIFDVVCSYFLKELLPFTAALEVLQHGGNFVSFLLTVKFTDASTVSSDIFEDYKVYISSKLTFIIFFWFLYRSLGYFVVTAQGENIVKKVGIVISRLFFLQTLDQSTYFLIMFFIFTNRCGDCNVLATLFALLSVMLHRLLKQSN